MMMHYHQCKLITKLFCYRLTPAIALVRKLISVLESIEKLPVYSYDLPGSGYGLQVCKLPVYSYYLPGSGYGLQIFELICLNIPLEQFVITTPLKPHNKIS